MRVARVSASLRVGCDTRGARLDHIWISDELLQATLSRFTSKYSRRCVRHGSSVPGPLEAQKRLSRRRMNAATLSNELPGFTDLTEHAQAPSWRARFKWRDPYREPPTSAKQLTYQPPSSLASADETYTAPDLARQHSAADAGPTVNDPPLETVQDIYIKHLQQTTCLAELKALSSAYLKTRFDLPAFADQVVEHALKLEAETDELLELLIDPSFALVAEKADPALLGLLIRSCVKSAGDIPWLLHTMSQHIKQHDAAYYIGPLLSAMIFSTSEAGSEVDACRVVRPVWELTAHLLPRLGQEPYQELYCEMLDSLAATHPTTGSTALIQEMTQDAAFQSVVDPDLLSACARHVLLFNIKRNANLDSCTEWTSHEHMSAANFVKALGTNQLRLLAKAFTRQLREEYRDSSNADLINHWVYTLHYSNTITSNVADNKLWEDVFGILRELSPSALAGFLNIADTESMCLLLLRHWILPGHVNLARVENTFLEGKEEGDPYFYKYRICESAHSLQRLVLALYKNRLEVDDTIKTFVDLYMAMGRPTVVSDFLLSLRILNNKRGLPIRLPATLLRDVITQCSRKRPRQASHLYKVHNQLTIEDCPTLTLDLIDTNRVTPRQITSLLEHYRGSLPRAQAKAQPQAAENPQIQGTTEPGDVESNPPDVTADAHFKARADIIHETALGFAFAPQWTGFTAFNLVRLCVEMLLEANAPLDSRATRALLHAAIVRPLAADLPFDPAQLRYAYRIAELTEELEVAAELRRKMDIWFQQRGQQSERKARRGFDEWLASTASLAGRKVGWAHTSLRTLD